MPSTISCPNCSTRYLLPEHLLGPAGARVSCPACWHRFTVDAAGAVMTPEVEPLYAAGSPAAPVMPASFVEPARAGSVPRTVAPRDDASTLAHEALAGLDPLADDLVRAAARGRLFAEYGPRLLEAFDRYRANSGPGVDAAEFRRAMRDRWNLDVPGEAPGRA